MMSIGRRTLGLSIGAAGLLGLERHTPRRLRRRRRTRWCSVILPSWKRSTQRRQRRSAIFASCPASMRVWCASNRARSTSSRRSRQSWTISPDGNDLHLQAARRYHVFHDGTKFDASMPSNSTSTAFSSKARPIPTPVRSPSSSSWVRSSRPRWSTPRLSPSIWRGRMRRCSTCWPAGSGLLARHFSSRQSSNMGRTSAATAAGAGPLHVSPVGAECPHRARSQSRPISVARRSSRGSSSVPIADSSARVSEMLSGGTDLMIEVPADDVPLFKSKPQFRLRRAGRGHISGI